MQWSVVDFSKVNNTSDFRIDAGRYTNLALHIHESIAREPHAKFFEIIVSIESGKNLKQNIDGHTAFIRTQNIGQIILEPDDISLTNQSMEVTKERDLLFVRVGEGVGNNCVVPREFAGCAFSDNVLRLKIKRLCPYYCAVFSTPK